MSNSDLPLPAQTPILLDKNHPLTALIMLIDVSCTMMSKRHTKSCNPLVVWYRGDSLSAR